MLPPVPTDERLSFAVDQFTGSGHGDQVVAAAMIDRIVHHAEVLTLKGSSYRLKDSGIDTLPSAKADNTAQ
jgi:hypothetical protein